MEIEAERDGGGLLDRDAKQESCKQRKREKKKKACVVRLIC